jgi:hypothetical protein
MTLKLDFKEEIPFLHKLGLITTGFVNKDVKDMNFLVVTRSDGDELCYTDPLSEGDINRLKNWIRCGDRTGLTPEWKEIDLFGFKTKVYLAGEGPGIDCTSVMDQMFTREDGKSYTYTRCKKTGKPLKIIHPHYIISLGNNSLPF